jgi:hypothetical protein
MLYGHINDRDGKFLCRDNKMKIWLLISLQLFPAI